MSTVASAATATTIASSPLQALSSGWWNVIDLAHQHKEPFTSDATEAMKFYNGPHDFMWDEGYKRNVWAGDIEKQPPSFRMTANKVSEVVQLFGPVLYHRNPTRKVTPRKLPELPAGAFGSILDAETQQIHLLSQIQTQQFSEVDKARAMLLEKVLNFSPNEFDLKTNSRRAIDETLIKGASCLWTEVVVPPGGETKYVASFYDTIDNLEIDPDAETIDQALWIARRRLEPVWAVERKFNLPPDSIKGTMESVESQGHRKDSRTDRKKGDTNDLLEYWEIYSRMGIGTRLKRLEGSEGYRVPNPEVFDELGDYVYLAVARNVPYPLNLAPHFLESPELDEEMLLQAVQWPTPFWLDNRWPVNILNFHEIPGRLWPMAHITPALGELKWINWCMSYMAGKVRTTSRDFIGVIKSSGDDLKDMVKHGPDLSFIEIEDKLGKSINDVVSFLQHPQMNPDLLRVLQYVMEMFDKRTGLTELMYGSTSAQYRSAAEAQAKERQLNVRPDDMANKVEDWMSEVARAEALAIRWHLEPQDVQQMIGPIGAQLWEQLIMPRDIEAVVREFEYRVMSGSSRKPNLDRDMLNMREAMQVMLPMLQQYFYATGDPTQLNQLLGKWGDLIGFETDEMVFPPRQPAPPEESSASK